MLCTASENDGQTPGKRIEFLKNMNFYGRIVGYVFMRHIFISYWLKQNVNENKKHVLLFVRTGIKSYSKSKRKFKSVSWSENGNENETKNMEGKKNKESTIQFFF